MCHLQEVDLEVWVYQPVVIITPNFLNFGPVCLKHTKHELLYIKSKTGMYIIILSIYHVTQKSPPTTRKL